MATREEDCLSIASDFSIIPESLVLEDSNTTSITSEVLRPSIEAEMAYGKVKFLDIQNAYTSDTDIAVSFTLSGIVPKRSDRVGLFKVGFQAPQEYHSYMWISTVNRSNTDAQLPHTVVFKAETLPKDFGEFYQFCYVTYESRIVGASRSFQLLPVGSLRHNDVSDDQEEGELIVVTSIQSSLHTTINQLKQDNAEFQSQLTEAKSDCAEVRNLLQEKTKLLALADDQIALQANKLDSLLESSREESKQVASLEKEKKSLEERVGVLEMQLGAAVKINTDVEGQLEQAKKENTELQNKLKEVTDKKEDLTNTLGGMTARLNSLSEANKVLTAKVSTYIAERDRAVQDLEMWTSNASSEKDDRVSLETKYHKTNEELTIKLEQLDMQKRTIEELENKLGNTVVHMDTVKSELTNVNKKLLTEEEQRREFEERQEVVNRDNDELKAIASKLQQQLLAAQQNEKEHCEYRRASEKVASDMSQRLLSARTEYQNLALVNLKLTKKLKKLRKSQSSSQISMTSDMMSSQTSDWLQVDDELDDDTTRGLAVALTQSCISNSAPSSSCTQTAEKLSKMEEQIFDLTSLVESLQGKLASAKSSPREESAEAICQEETKIENDIEKSETDLQQSSTTKPVENIPTTSSDNQTQTSAEDQQTDLPNQDDVSATTPEKDFYNNSFLPSQRTAPVFLPENSPARDLATNETNLASHSSAPMIYPRISIPSSQAELSLPSPLQPEATATARHVAVMHKIQSVQNPHSQQQESDDDDYHSTGDAGEARPPPVAPVIEQQPTLIECPMCSLTFQPSAMNLLETHINSHLEFVCPVCSMAFQNNNQKRYEEHVYTHFQDEDEPAADDNSGPWSHISHAAQFEID